MSTSRFEPFLHQNCRDNPKFHPQFRKFNNPPRLNYSSNLIFNGRTFCNFKPSRVLTVTAAKTDTALMEPSETSQVSFHQTFPLNRTHTVEGKISVRLDRGKDDSNWNLTVGCDLPGKWILHWGVNYVGDTGSEWDQPPKEMRPSGSVAIKDYAIETPLKKVKKVTTDGQSLQEVLINFNSNSSIAAINFVLKDEETGSWCQRRGRDFKIPLMDYVDEETNIVGAKQGFSLWPGAFGQLSTMFLKTEGSQVESQENTDEFKGPNKPTRRLEGFYEECPVSKQVRIDNLLTVSVMKSSEKDKNIVQLETDLPGDVVVHWGVCRENDKIWEIPADPHPPETKIFKNKALQTLLQPKDDGAGSRVSFSLDKKFMGMFFVLKLSDNTWMNHMGSDFYVPLSSDKSNVTEKSESSGVETSGKTGKADEVPYTIGIIKEIRNLVSDISSEKSRRTKTKRAHEIILQEIEKLAAEAYSIFRSSSPTFVEEDVSDTGISKPPAKLSSGTGSGYEILCQGFNWESHKSGRWYRELSERADELSALGFTVIWLPPPTESISPEGYMPRDLYNLNSRYGSMDELKNLVNRFHEVGLKVLGDAVLNHRCAHYQNQNGVWNIFGGRLNWDDRAVVADDPHFQGRGNKSSGDNFHAAPNIDHSQDFVRKDLKEWLCWMRKEIGYDGWRLDYVRGFWGGYVKDYMDASEPYFAVGEFWDSLSYTYGEMDHDQDAHRQRIIDWMNASSGAAGAFDVTTKGVLHAALERCEYWRLSDEKGKPPGVVGWWPSRAVTFIENHDTGSTQGHWRFPGGKEMQGYAYILTHPGTPSVFYDHIFSHYRSEISALLSLRTRAKIHCRSAVKITKVERDVYAAVIDEKVAMKIGPGHYEPPGGAIKWALAIEGRDYKVWEAS